MKKALKILFKLFIILTSVALIYFIILAILFGYKDDIIDLYNKLIKSNKEWAKL